MKAILKTVLLALAFTVTTAFAADRPDAGHLINENTPEPSLFPQQTPPALQKPDTTKRQQSSPGTAMLKVTGFSFIGNTLFSDHELSALMSRYIGQNMSFAALDKAAGTITSAYRKKGYFLASVYFPPQTVKPGMPVIIEIVEGVLEAIDIQTKPVETRTPKRLMKFYADQVPTRKPVRDRELTSMVMKTNELPNISSRILLEPGNRPGTTKATLEVTEGMPYSITLNGNNFGNPATGSYRIGSTLYLFSPLHLGDQLNLHLQTSSTADLQNVRAGYTVPVTSYGTKLGMHYSFVNYQLGGVFEAMNADGTAHDLSLSLTQPLIRQRNLILNATLAGEKRVMDDRMANIAAKKRHTTSLQIGLDGLQMDSTPEGSSTAFSIGFIGGNLQIDNSETLAIDQSLGGLHTNGRYCKLNFSLARTQSFYQGLSLYAGGYGQWSDKNLNSSEQLSLGGPSAVRAWQIDESYCDKGFVATAELRYLFRQTGEFPGKLQASAFVDHGYARLHTTPLPGAGNNTRSLTGAGIGVKWFDANNFSLQASCAWKVAGETIPANSPMIFVQVVKQL
ncbi:MAG: ShlB/FhaC/HecB family hemolysin secretion/activation protein [Chlorobium sp.]|nr:MAG: ShlB/FhaC/HecB family hemolysin secretion/activation protein [Chlorobium sp.]